MNPEQPQLTLAQALELTSQVFAKTQGNLQDHIVLQEALKLLKEATAEKPPASVPTE